MAFSKLYQHHLRLEPFDLEEFEQELYKGDTILHQIGQRLLSEVRTLSHELADPHYIYASDRIPRGAIVSRNAEIAQLRDEVKRLKSLNSGATGKTADPCGGM